MVGVALINNTEGVFNSTVRAGSGYNLLTVGPSIADEDGISSGNATTSQFSLQQPERWAEVSVVFSTGSRHHDEHQRDHGQFSRPVDRDCALRRAIVLLFSARETVGRPERPIGIRTPGGSGFHIRPLQ